jgi:N-acetylglucosaminyldiphosphoundecaprenol N-acetyl-beta-D-mannosaminyltransferase
MHRQSNTAFATPLDRAAHAAGNTVIVEQKPDTHAVPMPGNGFGRDVFCLFGLVFDRASLTQTTERIKSAIERHERLHIGTPNLNIVRLALNEPALRDTLLAADISLADGMPIVWMARLLRQKIPERVAGSDVFEALQKSKTQKTRTFFFGGSDEDARRLKAKFASNPRGDMPHGMELGGALAPGFGSVEDMSDAKTLGAINAARPDFLVVAVSARKGLLWIGRNENLLAAPVIANLGATIHFATNAIKRAPEGWRKSGLEWLWRIRQEPKLFSRYAKDFGLLMRLMVSQVLPLLVVQPVLKILATNKTRIRILPNATTRKSEIRLSGRVTEASLWPLREALSLLCGTQRQVSIDVARAHYLDPSALGLLLLAYGQMRRKGGDLSVTGAPWRMKVLFRLQGCAFLLKAGSSAARQSMRASPSIDRQSVSAPR